MRVMTSAADALRVFDAKRSHPPCQAGAHVRKLARNTYLEWLDDELLLLRFHQTSIARYVPEGVMLDFDGWRTQSTFARAETFTPLRTFAMSGLHFVIPERSASAYANANTLFTDGITIHEDGTVTGAPLPSAHNEIVRTVTSFPKKLRRWCQHTVRAWDRFDWAKGADVCANCVPDLSCGSAAFISHALDHIESNAPMPVSAFDVWAQQAPALEANELCTKLATKLYRTVREPLIRQRLANIDESFVWMPPGKSFTRRCGRAWDDPFQ